MKNKPEGKFFVIAHPMDSFHPDQGGGIRYLMNLIVSLKDLGWEPLVLGANSGKKTTEKQEWHQISLVGEKKGKPSFRMFPLWVKYLINLYLKLPFISIPEKAVILTHRIDCMLAFVIFKRPNPKVLVTAAPGYYLRRSHPLVYRFFGWVYHLGEKLCIRNLDAIVPTDSGTRDYYLERYTNIRLVNENIPSSIDLNYFKLISKEQARNMLHWRQADQIILFSGRLAAVKNIPLLIRAFERVAREFPSSRLVIVGDGEEWNTIKKLADRSSGRIDLIGRVDPAEMCNYYSGSDVLVLCSQEEGSPTSIKEALACGTPVVSTDVGDARKILSADPDLGCIVTPDEMKLASGISRYLNSSDTLAKRIKRGEHARQFDIHCAASRFDMIFHQTILWKSAERHENEI